MFKKKSPPKQLCHWIASSGLKLTEKFGNQALYFKGKGCRFRISNFERDGWKLCLGEVHETFDRWGNSTIDEVDLPQSLHTFRTTVENLSEMAQDIYSEYREAVREEQERRIQRVGPEVFTAQVEIE